MNYTEFYMEIVAKSHQDEMLLMAAEARLARQAPPRRHPQPRPWRMRLRGGIIAFGLRRQARRRRLASRRYATDWRAQVRAIIAEDE